jgi:hypothetical protein
MRPKRALRGVLALAQRPHAVEALRTIVIFRQVERGAECHGRLRGDARRVAVFRTLTPFFASQSWTARRTCSLIPIPSRFLIRCSPSSSSDSSRKFVGLRGVIDLHSTVKRFTCKAHLVLRKGPYREGLRGFDGRSSGTEQVRAQLAIKGRGVCSPEVLNQHQVGIRMH